MNKLALAFSITAKAFENKFDRGGKPYFLHCLFVWNLVKREDEDTQCAAIMHDLAEDCPEWTLSKLTELGFSDKTIGMLHLLTHNKGTDYMEYIKAISVCKQATKIKMADLTHNSSILRIKDVRKKDFDRLEKYIMAFKYLQN
jgi:GTP diphosphokinase / guanosine-3',5'-bis(diphosphate) 3'-diphosphatase